MKEKEIDDLFIELKETHVDDLDLSDPQYRLWARMPGSYPILARIIKTQLEYGELKVRPFSQSLPYITAASGAALGLRK